MNYKYKLSQKINKSLLTAVKIHPIIEQVYPRIACTGRGPKIKCGERITQNWSM